MHHKKFSTKGEGRDFLYVIYGSKPDMFQQTAVCSQIVEKSTLFIVTQFCVLFSHLLRKIAYVTRAKKVRNDYPVLPKIYFPPN